MSAKKRILSAVLATAMIASFAMTACTSTGAPITSSNASSTGSETSSTGSEASNSTPAAATGLYPGTAGTDSVTINLGTEPPQLNTITTTDTVSFNVIRHVISGLTALDQDDKPVAAVAKDWTTSEDGLTWTFNLRDDFKWNNGEPVTAKDFVFSFQRIVDPETMGDYSTLGAMFVNGAEIADGKKAPETLGVEAVDDYTLKCTLVSPVSYFLDLMAFGVFMPVNEKAYNDAGAGSDGVTLYGTDADKMAFNGPYVITSWAHESEMVLDKNPDYPDGDKIQIPKIIMKMMTESNTSMNSFKSNELDMIGLTSDQVSMMNGEGQTVYTYDDASCWYLEFNTKNTKNPALENTKIRKALTYALDTETFIKNVKKNNSIVLNRFVPPAINGNKDKFAKETPDYFKSHDVETAKTLLAEGMKEAGVDSLEVTFLIDEGDVGAKEGAFFQENLQNDLGIKVNVEQVPFKTRLERMSAHDFDICLAGWGPDYNDPMTFLELWVTDNGNNHTGWSNAKYDKLIADAKTEANRDTRFGYLMEAEALLMDEMPIGPYYGRARDYTVSSKLQGILRTGFQDVSLIYASIAQ